MSNEKILRDALEKIRDDINKCKYENGRVASLLISNLDSIDAALASTAQAEQVKPIGYTTKEDLEWLRQGEISVLCLGKKDQLRDVPVFAALPLQPTLIEGKP